MPLTVTCAPAITTFPGPDPLHPRRARQQARSLLAAWGLGEHADLAALIVSELVANAVRHGQAPVELRLFCTADDLRIEVHDHGAGRPVRKHAGIDDESGRGLQVLDGLTSEHGGEWNVANDQDGPGKTVYVTVPLEIDESTVQ